MTDPRTAALAEALHASKIGCDFVQVTTEGTAHWVERSCTTKDHEDAAAAILAALPPDWCGHDVAWTSAVTHALSDRNEELVREIARLREALERLEDRINALPTYDKRSVPGGQHILKRLVIHEIRAALEDPR